MSATPSSLDPEEVADLRRSSLAFPVVGIGASAGGMPAIQRLFENMPANNGMAFVIVLHLAPDNPSMAAAIIQRFTRMVVQQVEDDVPIEPDQVYVIPPDRSLLMNDGQLRLGPLERKRTHHVAIDQFFRSLGEVHRERGVAVVLSGAGADGAQGLKRVKERGGVTLVQSPADAEHDSMPLNAIAAGVADFVLPASDMGQTLIELWTNSRHIELPDPPADLHVDPSPTQDAEQRAEAALQTTMRLLKEQTGHDFSHYKRATMLRRIERRMQVCRQRTLEDYAAHLQADPHEPAQLLQDMLISVTNFFRDRAAFEALERVLIAECFEGRSPAEGLRAWVAGCATGEEAYSVAILLMEHANNASMSISTQLFATDVDEKALGVARAGIYADSISTDVPPLRLRQYFEAQPGQYVVTRALRQKVNFSSHNLLRDPPFSRLDLICCRNVLIYLDRSAQRQVLETLHFGLRPNGLLFLGSAETADAAPEHFTVVDKRQRIYRATAGIVERRVPPALNDPLSYLPPIDQAGTSLRRQLLKDLQEKLTAQGSPPAVVIDNQLKVAYLTGEAHRFLRLHAGELSSHLLHLVLPQLRLALRAAIAHAQQTAEPVHARRVSVLRDDRPVEVQITVRPLWIEPYAQSAKGWLVVLFAESEAASADAGSPSDFGAANQLIDLHEQLSAAIGESDSSNEALRAANEELQSVNEELRSTSEELETSKEELQSVNEELATVNFDLKMHLEASAKDNDDLQNFIASSDIATVFVDRDMRIKRFTPRASDIFKLLGTDLGRPLFDIRHRLDYEQMEADASEAFTSLRPIEREVASSDGRFFLARLLPYRSSDDRIEGVVLNFIDITARHRAEEAVRQKEQRLHLLFDSSVDYFICMLDSEGRITRWNKGAELTLGYTEEEVVGRGIDLIYVPEDRAAGVPAEERRCALVDGRAKDERWHLRKDGARVYFSGVMVLLSTSEQPELAKIARDLTLARQAADERDSLLASEQSLRQQLQQTSAMKDEFLAVMSHELKNPLNLIAMSAQMLSTRAGALDSAALKRIAANINASVKGQTQLIDDLLDLSRTQTGKLALHIEDVTSDDLVQQIVEAVQPDASKANVSVHLRIEPGNNYHVQADAVRIEQVVWNLVSNAVKFTPSGGKVVVRLQEEAAGVRIEVSDTGRGIAPDFLPRVFDMFRQADARVTKRGRAGLGIGLAIAKSLVEAHGGQITAASKGLEQGATFSVVLPRLGGEPAAISRKSDLAILEGLRILLVDDDVVALDTFCGLLAAAGAEPTPAASASEALELASKLKFDLIVSDIGMPHMDGFELIRHLRGTSVSDTPAIALTGFARAEDRRKALAAGYDEHLGKPLELDTFVSAVIRLTASKRIA